jgi:hypothetical protein
MPRHLAKDDHQSAVLLPLRALSRRTSICQPPCSCAELHFLTLFLQFYRPSATTPVVDVEIMELYRDHKKLERDEWQREVVLLGLVLLVLATVCLCIANTLLAFVPSMSPVWLIFVPLDLCALVVTLLRFALSIRS